MPRLFPASCRGERAVRVARDPLSPFASAFLGGASNAWAAAPTRSAAGGTLLANDPHLGFTAPTLWYLARLQLASGGVIGATIPGVPAILLGRSEGVGWGLTSSYLDDLDVHVEKLNPDNPEEYRRPTAGSRFETRRSILTVKDAPPVTLTLRWTDNGPVLPGSHFDLAADHAAGPCRVDLVDGAVARRHDHDRRDPDDAGADRRRRACGGRAVRCPVAEPDAGRPRRDRHADSSARCRAAILRNQSKGRMPNQGWLPQNRWQGTFPYADNPRFVNPTTGILGQHQQQDRRCRPSRDHVSFDWGDTERIQRWLTADAVA